MFNALMLKRLLYDRRMCQRDLAKAIGVSDVTVCRYLHSERVPKSDILMRIASVLNVPVSEFYTEEDSPESAMRTLLFTTRKYRSGWTAAEKIRLIECVLGHDE